MWHLVVATKDLVQQDDVYIAVNLCELVEGNKILLGMNINRSVVF